MECTGVDSNKGSVTLKLHTKFEISETFFQNFKAAG